MSPDDEACIAWLDGALERAFEDGKPGLWAYLQVVMEEVYEVYFEMQGGPSIMTYPTEGV